MEARTERTSFPTRILLVEDDDAVRRTLALHLRKRGHVVHESRDAESPLLGAEWQDVEYDIVLTDIHLPGVSGVEFAASLLKHSPYLPVILITGDPDEALAQEALTFGPVSYLLKPFELFALDIAVDQALTRIAMLEVTEEIVQQFTARSTDDGESIGGVPAAWLQLADRSSPAGVGHGYRVARMARVLAVTVSSGTPEECQPRLELAARVHELGQVLGPIAGAGKLPIPGAPFLSTLDLDPEVVRSVRHLHEHWDGTGGPERLSGSAIPQVSRILAVADAFDHLVSSLIGGGSGIEEAAKAAVERISSKSGIIYDPEVVEALRNSSLAFEVIWTLARWPGARGHATGSELPGFRD